LVTVVVSVARTPPFHDPHQPVFHDNSECLIGESLPYADRVTGEGGKERCKLCDALNRAEETRPPVVLPTPE
jgi:hypothetical protein